MSPTEEQLAKMQTDGNLQFSPTTVTYWFRLATAGEGPLAYEWQDKPHRLVRDLCLLMEADEVLRTAAPTLTGMLNQARDLASKIEALPNSPLASAASLAASEVFMALQALCNVEGRK
jgi:hypothetical protein